MTEPRPQWNHEAVKTEAAARTFTPIKEWAIAMGWVPSNLDEKTERELRAVVTLAVLESADAYAASRYLDDIIDMPVNGELVSILTTTYNLMPMITPEFVSDWVMKNGVRLTAGTGDKVKFMVGDLEMRGTCVAAIRREARCIVEVQTGPKTTANYTVLAEEITDVAAPKTAPTKGGTPPTGGTPVAGREGAQLKEAKVA